MSYTNTQKPVAVASIYFQVPTWEAGRHTLSYLDPTRVLRKIISGPERYALNEASSCAIYLLFCLILKAESDREPDAVLVCLASKFHLYYGRNNCKIYPACGLFKVHPIPYRRSLRQDRTVLSQSLEALRFACSLC